MGLHASLEVGGCGGDRGGDDDQGHVRGAQTSIPGHLLSTGRSVAQGGGDGDGDCVIPDATRHYCERQYLDRSP